MTKVNEKEDCEVKTHKSIKIISGKNKRNDISFPVPFQGGKLANNKITNFVPVLTNYELFFLLDKNCDPTISLLKSKDK